MRLNDIAHKIRSKNAGPFSVSIDVFCEDEAAYQLLKTKLKTEAVAHVLDVPSQSMKRYEIEHLRVIKFSFPRSTPQGSRYDRDMHGAQFAHVLAGLDIPA